MPLIYLQFLAVAIKSSIKRVYVCHTHCHVLKTFANLKFSETTHFIIFLAQISKKTGTNIIFKIKNTQPLQPTIFNPRHVTFHANNLTVLPVRLTWKSIFHWFFSCCLAYNFQFSFLLFYDLTLLSMIYELMACKQKSGRYQIR